MRWFGCHAERAMELLQALGQPKKGGGIARSPPTCQ
jgi:hypothetical protein